MNLVYSIANSQNNHKHKKTQCLNFTKRGGQTVILFELNEPTANKPFLQIKSIYSHEKVKNR